MYLAVNESHLSDLIKRQIRAKFDPCDTKYHCLLNFILTGLYQYYKMLLAFSSNTLCL